MTQPFLFDRINAEPIREDVYTLHRQELTVETALEAERRDSAADRILAALRTGPKTNLELIDIAQRISGRIYDLRHRGYQIVTEPLAPGIYRYTLMGGRS